MSVITYVNVLLVGDGGKLLVVDGKLLAAKDAAMIRVLVDYNLGLLMADAQIPG